MSKGAWIMAGVVVVTFGSLGFLLWSMFHSIRKDRDRRRSIWKEYGLSLVLMILFFSTWIGHGVTSWQRYTDEQKAHQEQVAVGDFLSEFGESTLENWQSEFLQLFSFVTLAALFIHKGSGESKDGEEKLEASLRRIEEKLGTLPENAPKGGSSGSCRTLPTCRVASASVAEAGRATPRGSRSATARARA